ncbi:peptide chain release factor N(5)-glutamine methyltransferase [Sphingobacterium bovistauri]|uniref:peptide chain release factor N(5)-glutamine methyltransferase n=1 Tax=Sphingobacterium bovistauri TaxID=2781959 RepID=A0ABS7ZBA8_9SPHI|nr:peptide chain release factor N(5)-glutamine methyltransferase [Sphingobacterium bovistauri]MCA5006716.1 peptide chain release factor N(5)-glutamine methyltransferase [Sphingobacterium bovistauri]
MVTTWKDIENLYQQHLTSLYPADEIKALFLIVLEEIAGINAAKYIVEKTNSVDNYSEQLTSILQELSSGRPLQHILGKADFYGEKFEVNVHTLIPRPETEELVHLIINDYKNKKELKVIDVGTGSGCIPITLKKHLNQSEVWAVDISKEALEVAKRNANSLNQHIQFILADILEWEFIFSEPQNFDIIVSNPPYITPKEMTEMHANVLHHEPHTALFVEESAPLIFYDYIADFANQHLSEHGTLYFEINQYLSLQTAELIRKKGFRTVEIFKDINGVDRMIRAKRK